MILNLTDLSDEPLQGQITRQIRAMILAGDLEAGTSLPSIRVLAREQHVSVITVQRAYEHLINQGLIHSRRGKGFFVSEVSSTEKKDMAEQRLYELMRRPIKAAAAEGLSTKDIHQTINRILNNENLDD